MVSKKSCMLNQYNMLTCVLWASHGAQWVKNLPAVLEIQETRVRSLCWEDPSEEGMVTHSSILAWGIPRTEEPGEPQSVGSQRMGHDWSDLALMHATISWAWLYVKCISCIIYSSEKYCKQSPFYRSLCPWMWASWGQQRFGSFLKHMSWHLAEGLAHRRSSILADWLRNEEVQS